MNFSDILKSYLVAIKNLPELYVVAIKIILISSVFSLAIGIVKYIDNLLS